MDSQEVFVSIVICLFLLAVVASFLVFATIIATPVIVLLCSHSYTKKKELIFENSERIKSLLSLNKNTYFRTINSLYTYNHSCKSKRQLDNYSIDDFFISIIDSNKALFNKVISDIEYNRSAYVSYLKSVYRIKSSATEAFCNNLKIKLEKFLKYEEKFFEESIIKTPTIYVCVHCIASYISPKGKRYYNKEMTYELDQIKHFLAIANRTKTEREKRQYQIKIERSKMSDSLRYDILKRDKFTCQICGSTAQDGVKLHVDHIIPVSKGGKTVKSNLRTLCDRCNLGKSNKL